MRGREVTNGSKEVGMRLALVAFMQNGNGAWTGSRANRKSRLRSQNTLTLLLELWWDDHQWLVGGPAISHNHNKSRPPFSDIIQPTIQGCHPPARDNSASC